MSARSARLSSSTVGIVLAAAVLVGVNYLASRHWKRFDWTGAQVYSLSETTKKTLDALKTPVQVTVFMTPHSRLSTEVKELLSRYQARSPRIEVEYLDPERNPARGEVFARESGAKVGTVAFRSGDRRKYVEEDKLADFDYTGAGMGGAPSVKAFKGEEAFTSAILSVTESRQPKIVFSKGHDEQSLDSAERGRGYSEVKQLLERDNMTVATWDSLGKGGLPADADVVVVAGPRLAFLAPEAEALEKYLAGGGRVLLLLDPVLPGPGAPPPDLGLKGLLDKYGIQATRRHRHRPRQRPGADGRGGRACGPLRQPSDRPVARGREAAGDLPARPLDHEGREAARGRGRDDARRDLPGGLGRDEPEAARRRDQEGPRRHARARIARRRDRAGRREEARPEGAAGGASSAARAS